MQRNTNPTGALSLLKYSTLESRNSGSERSLTRSSNWHLPLANLYLKEEKKRAKWCLASLHLLLHIIPICQHNSIGSCHVPYHLCHVPCHLCLQLQPPLLSLWSPSLISSLETPHSVRASSFSVSCTSPHRYLSGQAKIIQLLNLLTGKALQWATVVWEQGSKLLSSSKYFVTLFCWVFDHATEGKEMGKPLLVVMKGRRRAVEYTPEFCMLAAERDSVEGCILPEAQQQCSHWVSVLQQGCLTQLSHQFNHLTRQPAMRSQTTLPSLTSYMLAWSAWAHKSWPSPPESSRVGQEGLCFYSVGPGHTIAHCPSWGSIHATDSLLNITPQWIKSHFFMNNPSHYKLRSCVQVKFLYFLY